MSPSSSTEIADRQFVVICSEKEAKVGIIVLARGEEGVWSGQPDFIHNLATGLASLDLWILSFK